MYGTYNGSQVLLAGMAQAAEELGVPIQYLFYVFFYFFVFFYFPLPTTHHYTCVFLFDVHIYCGTFGKQVLETLQYPIPLLSILMICEEVNYFAL